MIEIERDIATYRAWPGNSVTLYNDGCAGKDGGGAFADIERAIGEAQHFIFIFDWSFHPLFRLRPDGPPIGEILAKRSVEPNGPLVAIHTWNHTVIAADDLQNDDAGEILRSFLRDAIAALPPLPGGGVMPQVDERGFRPNLLWRKSSRNNAPHVGFSHHQKLIVLDAPSPSSSRRLITAFFGGLDLTKGRYDWPEHRNDPDDARLKPLQKSTTYPYGSVDEWYNLELGDNHGVPRQTWHDVHARLTGPAAWDFVREFVGRWTPDPQLDAPDTPQRDINAVADLSSLKVSSLYVKRPVVEKFSQLLDPARFIQQEEKGAYPPGPFVAQVVRSIRREHWTPPQLGFEAAPRKSVEEEFPWASQLNWSVRSRDGGGGVEASIQEMYRRLISRARRFVYIETQYFIGAATRPKTDMPNAINNDIPARLVDRILSRASDDEDFHVYVVTPLFPEGKPTEKANRGVRYNQWQTIEAMVRALHRQLGDGWRRYLSFYFLAQWSENPGTPGKGAGRNALLGASRRYMIYVHAKAMICDDTSMIIGSCNLNERGLAGGRDTEICAGLWPDAGKEFECTRTIQDLRRRLWTEHLAPGLEARDLPGSSSWWLRPESRECSGMVQMLARRNYLNFRLNKDRKQSGHLCAWPIVFDPQRRDAFSLGVPVGSDYREVQFSFDYEHELIPDHEAGALLRKSALTPQALQRMLDEVRKNPWAIRPLEPYFGYLTQ